MWSIKYAACLFDEILSRPLRNSTFNTHRRRLLHMFDGLHVFGQSKSIKISSGDLDGWHLKTFNEWQAVAFYFSRVFLFHSCVLISLECSYFTHVFIFHSDDFILLKCSYFTHVFLYCSCVLFHSCVLISLMCSYFTRVFIFHSSVLISLESSYFTHIFLFHLT